MSVEIYPTDKGGYLYLRIAINGDCKDVPMKKKVYKGEIDNKNRCVSRKNDRKNELEQIIAPIKNCLEAIAQPWIENGITFSAQELKDEYKKRTKNTDGVDESTLVSKAFNQKIESCIQKKREKNGCVRSSKGTAGAYKSCRTRLICFCNEKNILWDNFTFSDITENFLKGFICHNEKFDKKKGNLGTVACNVKCLKAIFHEAQRNNVPGINNDAWNNIPCYSLSRKQNHTILTIPQIDILTAYRPKPMTRGRKVSLDKYQLYIDMFLFSYYAAGLASVDFSYLKYSDIKEGRILVSRWKTIGGFKEKKQDIDIVPEIIELIEKYRGKTTNGFVFPIIDKCDSDKQESCAEKFRVYANNYLARVCKELGLPKVTLYAARHTYATHRIASGSRIIDVASTMGNTTKIIEEHYYERTEEVRKEDLNRWVNYRNQQRMYAKEFL
ncbi:MAG: phage integrase SAM-like domain-containing protein [Parabacteroides sp.]|nr:phage integrase SAM-like domain-containing protein [Parabacteroides sp.]